MAHKDFVEPDWWDKLVTRVVVTWVALTLICLVAGVALVAHTNNPVLVHVSFAIMGVMAVVVCVVALVWAWAP